MSAYHTEAESLPAISKSYVRREPGVQTMMGTKRYKIIRRVLANESVGRTSPDYVPSEKPSADLNKMRKVRVVRRMRLPPLKQGPDDENNYFSHEQHLINSTQMRV